MLPEEHMGVFVTGSLPRLLLLKGTVLFGSNRENDPDALVILEYAA